MAIELTGKSRYFLFYMQALQMPGRGQTLTGCCPNTDPTVDPIKK